MGDASPVFLMNGTKFFIENVFIISNSKYLGESSPEGSYWKSKRSIKTKFDNCVSSGLTTSILIPHFINKFLGGHNGDSYGAGLVITETTNLLLLSIILVPN